MSKEKQENSLLDLITAENLQEVNSDKKGLEELTKRFNEVTEFLFATDEVQKVLKEKDKTIAELEEQLKNAIVPKFKIGQKVYKVYTPNQKYPFEFKIIGFKITKSKGEDNIFYNVEEDGFDMGWYPDEILFATKKEAEQKLKEIKYE